MWNGVYCVYICLWAVIFVESWKRKEAALVNLWGCSDVENTSADEIDGYRCVGVWNGLQQRVEHARIVLSNSKAFGYQVAFYALNVINILVMLAYFELLQTFDCTTETEDGQVSVDNSACTVKPGPIDANVLTAVYSLLCVVVAYIFQEFVNRWTETENNQYHSGKEHKLSFRHFAFNFFVYFLPNLITMFQVRDPNRYSALAYLMFTQMVFK